MANKTIEERMATVETDISYIREDIKDIKDNHLKQIYDKIECIIKKMAVPRPTWTVAWLITFLGSTVIGLLVLLLTRRL